MVIGYWKTAGFPTFGDWPLLVGNFFNAAEYKRIIVRVRHGPGDCLEIGDKMESTSESDLLLQTA